ncbi:hypothetical protein Dimus_014326 [Dionaea muscipula]
MVHWWRNAGDTLMKAAAAVTATANSRTYRTIQAIPREVTGPRVSVRDRTQGRIPAVVFTQLQQQLTPSGKSNVVSESVSRKQILTTERKQIHSILKSMEPEFFCSTTFKLQIRAGSGSSMLLESRDVLPIKIHRDKETGKVLNLAFVWADEGSELTVDVPLVFKGKDSCPGLKKGGHLYMIRNRLKFLCPAEQIPQKIEVDVSNLDIGDKVMLHDIKYDPSLKLLSMKDRNPLCKVLASSPDCSRSVEV